MEEKKSKDSSQGISQGKIQKIVQKKYKKIFEKKILGEKIGCRKIMSNQQEIYDNITLKNIV